MLPRIAAGKYTVSVVRSDDKDGHAGLTGRQAKSQMQKKKHFLLW